MTTMGIFVHCPIFKVKKNHVKEIKNLFRIPPIVSGNPSSESIGIGNGNGYGNPQGSVRVGIVNPAFISGT